MSGRKANDFLVKELVCLKLDVQLVGWCWQYASVFVGLPPCLEPWRLHWSRTSPAAPAGLAVLSFMVEKFTRMVTVHRGLTLCEALSCLFYVIPFNPTCRVNIITSILWWGNRGTERSRQAPEAVKLGGGEAGWDWLGPRGAHAPSRSRLAHGPSGVLGSFRYYFGSWYSFVIFCSSVFKN